jgi:hypothetical protein
MQLSDSANATFRKLENLQQITIRKNKKIIIIEMNA